MKQLMSTQGKVKRSLEGAPSDVDAGLAKALGMDAERDLEQLNWLAKTFEDLPGLKKGDFVTFTWKKDGSCVMTVRGECVESGTLTRTPVIYSLFNVYCGHDAVSVEGSSTLRNNLAAMCFALLNGDDVTQIARA
jgi:hypothetical protein